jgi:hypothetical protein
MKITKSQAIKLAIKYKINLDVIDINEWHYGLNVELEHGNKLGTFTNITNNNLSITAKIVIAHLTEFPDYYKRLLKLETQADKYWSSRNKPNIFI